MAKSKSKWTRCTELLLTVLELVITCLAQAFFEHRSTKTDKK